MGKPLGHSSNTNLGIILDEKYFFTKGSSANGIDLPSEDILTDIKVTSIRQPQSSCPFKDAKQKIFGLGYNLLVFVYDKTDDIAKKVAKLDFISCTFIKKERTADYQTTFSLRQMLQNDANTDDIIGYLMDRNIPADEITLNQLAEEILKNKPSQGYLTISNALQWRLQYGRVVRLGQEVDGIIKIVDKVNGK